MYRQYGLRRAKPALIVIILILFASFATADGGVASLGPPSSVSCPLTPSLSLAKLQTERPSQSGLMQALLTSRVEGPVSAGRVMIACAQSTGESAQSAGTPLPSLQLPTGQATLWRASESLMALLRMQEPAYQEISQGEFALSRDYFLVIGDLASLATQIDWVSKLVKPLLNADSPESEVQLEFGQASLKAKLDFMAGILQYVVESLRSSHVPLPSGEGVTLVFDLNGVVVDVATALKESPANRPPGAGSDQAKNQIGLDHITVTITNGSFTSAAELNPSDFTITRGHLQLQFHLGLDSITSTTSFTKDQGLAKEVLVVSARLGGVDLVGQATFAKGIQEYKLQASFNPDLAISTTSLWTPEGFVPGFGFNLNFCVLGCTK